LNRNLEFSSRAIASRLVTILVIQKSVSEIQSCRKVFREKDVPGRLDLFRVRSEDYRASLWAISWPANLLPRLPCAKETVFQETIFRQIKLKEKNGPQSLFSLWDLTCYFLCS